VAERSRPPRRRDSQLDLGEWRSGVRLSCGWRTSVDAHFLIEPITQHTSALAAPAGSALSGMGLDSRQPRLLLYTFVPSGKAFHWGSALYAITGSLGSPCEAPAQPGFPSPDKPQPKRRIHRHPTTPWFSARLRRPRLNWIPSTVPPGFSFYRDDLREMDILFTDARTIQRSLYAGKRPRLCRDYCSLGLGDEDCRQSGNSLPSPQMNAAQERAFPDLRFGAKSSSLPSSFLFVWGRASLRAAILVLKFILYPSIVLGIVH